MKNTSSQNLHCKETPRPSYLHNSCSRREIKQINIVLFCEKCEFWFIDHINTGGKCGSEDVLVLKREITRSVIQGP